MTTCNAKVALIRARKLYLGTMDHINSRSLEGAIQMLVWAIEEIEKIGNQEALHHARLALKYLVPPDAEPATF